MSDDYEPDYDYIKEHPPKPPKTEILFRLSSPDGQWDAVLMTRDKNYLDPYNYYLFIFPKGKLSSIKKSQLFDKALNKELSLFFQHAWNCQGSWKDSDWFALECDVGQLMTSNKVDGVDVSWYAKARPGPGAGRFRPFDRGFLPF
ncbi:hypothetical protein MAIT1_01616 [Magnetofaba australis IT-1]|uniref:Uncharacterized protein n=2 Tax=Magnetofaba TaxID=1472292 RepID=A0A1Y2K0Y6_9PROT|nr:hypothetical protein MAIT1_01616 [Magnetofaba australis IT-1]